MGPVNYWYAHEKPLCHAMTSALEYATRNVNREGHGAPGYV
jgi:hypothetical protein